MEADTLRIRVSDVTVGTPANALHWDLGQMLPIASI